MSRRRRWRREPVAISGEVGRYRRSSSAGGENAALQAAWVQIVGAAAGTQSMVVRRSRAGVVSIACASASWAQELDMRRDRWVAELASACPDLVVTGMRFVIGDHVMPAQTAPPTPVHITPTDAELAQAEAQTPSIEDPKLQELLVRAQAAQMALARERKHLQKAKKPGRSDRSG